ncbi:MAG: substrate-binding domain-containing protein [Ruminococcus sp.]|nr:substrate-binding domain-containing protein [Ruminococcus sp.]
MNEHPLIGIISAKVSDPEQHLVLGGILSQAEKQGAYTAVFSNIYNFNEYFANTEVENKIYELVASPRLDGIILIADAILHPFIQQYIYERFSKSGIPVVVTGAHLEGFICINNDVRRDMQDIARHITDVHGFTVIDVLTGYENIETSHERVNGVRDILGERNIPFGDENIIYGDFWTTSGEKLAMEYISGKRRMPQALICASDYMAYGVIDTLFEHGINVPDDITVVGYEYAGKRFYHSPILTTYRRSRKAIGEKAANILCSMINNTSHEDISLDGCMILGDTCKCRTDKYFFGQELNEVRNVQYYADLNISGNFEQQLTVCRSISDYIHTLQEFAYLLRNVKGIYLCLYENWCNISEKTDMNKKSDDEIMTLYRVISPIEVPSEPHFFIRKMLFTKELYGAGDKYFLYFVPIFSSGIDLGYFIFQYTEPDCYDTMAVEWLKSAVNALIVLKMKNDIHELIECNNLSEFHDTATGLYNRKGLIGELENTAAKSAKDDKISVVMIKTGIFSDDSRIEEKNTDLRIDNETAECIRRISDSANSFCGKIGERQFVLVSSGKIPENYGEIISDRLESMIGHSPLYSSKYSFCSIIISETVVSAENFSAQDIISNLENEILLRSPQISEIGKSNEYAGYADIRNEMYKHPEKIWDAYELCRHFQLSCGHFRAEYKKIFGISFHRDLIRSRISMAKYLLMTSPLSISTIARKCGYEDDKYFLRQFRTVTGSTPNSYRHFRQKAEV